MSSRREAIHVGIEERVDGLVHQRAHRNADSPRRSFRMVMRGRAGYGPGSAGGALAPLCWGRVSLPYECMSEAIALLHEDRVSSPYKCMSEAVADLYFLLGAAGGRGVLQAGGNSSEIEGRVEGLDDQRAHRNADSPRDSFAC